ncbi:MAG: trypsin-like peptidase domain-containing protein [Planctomycetota bacterium]|nr:trypsin-like peptidase domain-containing protein [Planctomycetota bacterium]
MLTKYEQFMRGFGLAIGLTCASASQAQVTLKPAAPVDSLVRPKPVSRDAMPFEAGRLNAPVHPTYTNRRVEYADLQREAEALERQFNFVRRIVKFVSPSIVHLEATKRAETGNGFSSSKVEEAGAGIIIDIDGAPFVLTNRHVIHPAELNSIRIETNAGIPLRATKIWTDPSTDVAVLKLATNQHLPPAVIGDSNNAEVGDFVIAVGSPFGLSHSVTYGILSAKGRRNLELGSKEIEIQDFFQTDAAINPGNSGGPLINLRGEIIGINTAIASNSGGNEGIGFSIPMNMALNVARQLVSQGQLNRSYLGVQLENAFDIFTARRLGLKSTTGALVKVVIPNSPAAKCGLKEGDVILDFNGKQIENDGHLVKQVGLTKVGSRVSITIFRDGKVSQLNAHLEANPGR